MASAADAPAPEAGGGLPSPSVPSPLTPSTRQAISRASTAASSVVLTPGRAASRARLASSASAAARLRKEQEEERIRNLKGLAYVAHRVNQHRATLTLAAWLSNLYAFMTGHGRFKALRWMDAPFVLWLQRPKNLAHQFVTHGFGQVWAPMLAVEMAYAWAYSSKRLFLTRWLLLPLAAYYWSVFNRIAVAEQRLRNGKGKHISWEEYLCIYLPFALKSGFLAASACINVTAMVAVDFVAPTWVQVPVALATQLVLLVLGAYAIVAHDCYTTLGWMLWALNGQPRPVPYFTAAPTLLLVIGRVFKTSRDWVRRTSAAQTPQALAAASPLASASPRLHKATQELDHRLAVMESFAGKLFHEAVTQVHYVQIYLYTHMSPSSPGFRFGSPRFSPLKRNKKVNDDLDSSAASAAGDSSSEEAAATPKSLRKMGLPSAGLPLYLLAGPALILSFLLGAMLTQTLAPPKAVLLQGETLRVGESLKYRCSISDVLAPSGCRDLELVLTNDGALSLYRDRKRTEAALVWRSQVTRPQPAEAEGKGKKDKEDDKASEPLAPVLSDRYVASVDERSRLVVSLGDEVVFRTPRLVTDPRKNTDVAASTGSALAIDGVLGGLYVTNAPEEQGEPTFVSFW